MSGAANYPTSLDDDSSLVNVTDSVTAIAAAHHNNIKEAVKAIEAKLGIFNTSVPTSLDYRVGNPTDSHRHDNASGQGRAINPSTFGGLRQIVQYMYPGSIPSGASLGTPLSIGRTMQVEAVNIALRKPPTGATLVLDINFGATSLWVASQGNRPMFPAGSGLYGHASPNLVTYPSGALIVIDADKVGTTEPGTDLSIVFVFRE